MSRSISSIAKRWTRLTWPTFEPSATTMRRRAARIIRRFDLGLGDVDVRHARLGSIPWHSRIATCPCTWSRIVVPNGLTSECCSRRSVPPVSMTVMRGIAGSSSSATRSAVGEHGDVVEVLRAAIARAIAATVVPTSRQHRLPALHQRGRRRADRRLLGGRGRPGPARTASPCRRSRSGPRRLARGGAGRPRRGRRGRSGSSPPTRRRPRSGRRRRRTAGGGPYRGRGHDGPAVGSRVPARPAVGGLDRISRLASSTGPLSVPCARIAKPLASTGRKLFVTLRLMPALRQEAGIRGR